jgi:hypothetical protein
MTLYFFLGGLAAFIVFGCLTHFRGELANRLRLICMSAAGVALLFCALLLLVADPWATPDRIEPTGVHRPSTGVMYAILLFVVYAGPQITGLVLAAVALYILRGARDAYWLHKRGRYD